MKDIGKSLLIDVIIAIIIAAGVLYFIRPTIVRQTSMQDTLNPNDYVILYKRAYASNPPERGDIIVFESDLTDEAGKDKYLIKRIIGIPGDEIRIENGNVYLNGELLEEDYISDETYAADGNVFNVPEDKYFVMGDHRSVSVDSRYADVGYVDRDTIYGKAVFRLFPLSKIGAL